MSSSSNPTCSIRNLQIFLCLMLACVFGGFYRYTDFTTTPRWTRWINYEHHELVNSSQQVSMIQVSTTPLQRINSTLKMEEAEIEDSSYELYEQVASTPADEEDQWGKEQENRRENLRQQCASLGLGSNLTEGWLSKYKSKLNHILVSDKHKAMYCYVPKVACTNWKEVLLVMNGLTTHDRVKTFSLQRVHSTTQAAKWRLSKYSTKDILRRLQTYKKFLFVRDPFSRTLSTYRDKFETDKALSRSFRRSFGNNIHIKYGNHPQLTGKKPPAGGYDVTFQEFAKYIGDRKISTFRGGPTEHWIPMVDLCSPCTVNYDMIGHLETLEVDTANILEQIGASKSGYMDLVVGQSPHGTNSSKRKSLTEYFEQLTEPDIEGIRWRYERDFKVFGYSVEVPKDQS